MKSLPNIINYFKSKTYFILDTFTKILKAIIIIFIINYFISNQLLAQANELKIEITVIDKVGNEPLAETEIIVLELGKRFQTNKIGKLSTSVPNKGKYNIRILGTGGIDKRTIDVQFSGQKFNLFSTNETQGIEVKGLKDKSNLSSYSLSQEEIKRMPGTQGDSLKAIQTLPGILPGIPIGLNPTPQFNVNLTGLPYSNSDRGDFVLRGAGPRANQTYFDGLPVSYPFHLGGQSSVFNNNIISDLEILTGAYSVRYGYATGGIINVESKKEVNKKKVVLNLNTFLSDAYVETPLWEGSYMLVGARKSYPNIFLLQVYPQGIPEDSKYADFQDFQWKFATKLGQDHTISLTFLGARDIQGYSRTQADFERNNGNPDNRPPVGLDRQFYTQGFAHEWKINNWIRHNFRASRNSFKEYYEIKFDSPVTAENVFGLNNTTTQDLYFVENSILLQIFEPFSIEAGGNFRERNIGLKAENITSQSSLFAEVFDDLLNSSPSFRALVDGDGILTRERGAFLEAKFKYENLLIIAGTRYDNYNLTNEKKNSPRGSIAYTFEKTNTTIQAGSGIFRIAPVGIEQISLKSGNSKLGMESAEHSVVGISQEIANRYSIKIEGFRNVFRDIVVNDSYIQNPYALKNNPRDFVERFESVQEQPFETRGLGYSNRGYGYSEGVEIFLRKNPDQSRVSGWFGWISYSNSITKRNNNQPNLTEDETTDRARDNFGKELRYQTVIKEGYINVYDDDSYEFLYNNDRERLYDLDRTHILSVVFGWKLSQDWQLGGRFRYATSVPVTKLTGSSRVGQAATFGLNLYIPEYSEDYNNHRLPSTHQLDVRLDRFFHYGWGYMNWYLEFLNLYGRRNPISEFYDNTLTFSNANPTYNYDTLNSPYIQGSFNGGRKIYYPMIHFGIEVKF
ncbi:TonB-dependent receptor plug domain-containing protein [Leptospira sp. GIMC2001]|uniref:TonB-dependent receptor plug domain-containing protein n=1 Tax=Leptospira sp. GIMC2001 TaxID=1513297 RepID=UPI00234AC55C|nr:TonB-dependent receptor [Leptospira sp. GIMC2001]WCL50401.1 TonB-dependent receptor [Leptospira sp. GIMC2001]